MPKTELNSSYNPLLWGILGKHLFWHVFVFSSGKKVNGEQSSILGHRR